MTTLTAKQAIALDAITLHTSIVDQVTFYDGSEKAFRAMANALVKMNLVTKNDDGEYIPVTQEVEEEFVAPMVYSHYQALPEAPVVEQVTPVEPEKINVMDYVNLAKVAVEASETLSVRKVEGTNSVTYIRLNRNALKARAFEFHRNTDKFRVYSGGALDKAYDEAMQLLGASVKPGNHTYYDFEMTATNICNVIQALSK